MSRYQKYTELIELANDGSRAIGKIPLAQVVRVSCDLSVVQAAQLAKLAIHLNRTPSEIVADAVKKHLETGGQP